MTTSTQTFDDTMAAQYLSNQLSEEDRERFENAYLENPDLLSELNRTAQFKSGLFDLRESGALQGALSARRWNRPQWLAIAAAIALVILAGWFWSADQRVSRQMMATNVEALSDGPQLALPIAGSYQLQRTRSISYDATIERPTVRSAIEIKIRPETPSSTGKYHVMFGRILPDDTFSKVSELPKAEASTDGFVGVYLDSSMITPGVYEIRVSSDATGNGTTITSFLLEVVEPAPKQ